jgi:hypothetical protein
VYLQMKASQAHRSTAESQNPKSRDGITLSSFVLDMSPDREVIVKAFWLISMLTGEHSEIVAELPFPQSSLNSWEQLIPWPNAQAEDFINTFQRDGYMTALWVRKHLNTILPKLYGYGHQNSQYCCLQSWTYN